MQHLANIMICTSDYTIQSLRVDLYSLFKTNGHHRTLKKKNNTQLRAEFTLMDMSMDNDDYT
jgi:hypothetical protein